MSKHNNSNGFSFEPNNKGNEDNEAAQFDQELEWLLQTPPRSHPPQQTNHSEMLSLAVQLSQEAPAPLRPDPAFVARLAADVRQRAQAQKLQTAATKLRRQRGSIFGLRWRLGGGVVLATLVLVTLVVAFNGASLFKSNPDQATTLQVQASNFTTLAAPTITAAIQPTQTWPASTPLVATEPASVQNLAAFGQLPTSSYLPEAANPNGKPPLIGPRLQTINSSPPATTPVLANFVTPLNPITRTLLPNTDATASTSLAYYLNTNPPTLSATGQVYRQAQPQINEAKLRTLGQRLGLDTSVARFDSQPSGNMVQYMLTENDKTLAIGSNGHLLFTEPKVAPGKIAPLSDNAAINTATAYLNKLGLSLDTTPWGTLKQSLSPVGVGDNSGLRFVSFSPVRFVGDKTQAGYSVSDAITLEVTINANSQVTFFDSNLPLQVDDQGGLNFAPMEATSYPLLTSDQLRTAIEKGHISPTMGTALRLQQKSLMGYRPGFVNISSVEFAYCPTYNSEGRLYMLPVVLVHGIFDNGDSVSGNPLQPNDFEGYVVAVQSQYLQSN